MPLQLLTAEEKVSELVMVLEDKEREIEMVKEQWEQQLQEKIDSIVQKEVAKSVGGGGGGGDRMTMQQVQYMDKQLKVADEKNEALKRLIQQKDLEIERQMQ